VAKLEASQDVCRSKVMALEDGSGEQQTVQVKLEGQISVERQLREQTVASLAHKVEGRVTELREQIDAKCELSAGEAKQEIAASFDALKDIITEERAAREKALENSASKGLADSEVRKLVTDICTKEREQAKILLSHAKQILDSDKVLRQRLQGVLQAEMVSKDELRDEMTRMLSMGSSRFPGPDVSTPRPDVCGTKPLDISSPNTFLQANPSASAPVGQLGSASVTPGRDQPVRMESHGLRRELSRGSSPLPPTRVSVSNLPQAHAWQSTTPSVPLQTPRTMAMHHASSQCLQQSPRGRTQALQSPRLQLP
jgi:hypothetical protein